MSTTVHIVVGRTGSGKSSLCKALSKKLGIEVVKTYTTRKKRFKEYIFGSDHKFVNSIFDVIENKEKDCVAYTKIANNEYFTALSSLTGECLLTLDPKGVESFFLYFFEQGFSIEQICKGVFRLYKRINVKGQGVFVTLSYVEAEEDVRRKRSVSRSFFKKKAVECFIQRNCDENVQFWDFEDWWLNEAFEFVRVYSNNRSFESCLELLCVNIRAIRRNITFCEMIGATIGRYLFTYKIVERCYRTRRQQE